MRLMDVFTKLEQQEVLETLIQFQTTFMVGGGIIILCSHDFEKLFHSTLTEVIFIKFGECDNRKVLLQLQLMMSIDEIIVM